MPLMRVVRPTARVLLPGFTLFALHTSLGGQPVFGQASLED